MSRRAFRPEGPVCLEERSLLSGLARPSAHPVVLSRLRFNQVGEHMSSSFLLASLNRLTQYHHLRQQLRDVAVFIPYGRVDGLGASINRIINEMRDDIASGTPYTVATGRAEEDVLAATRAVVDARVRAGDVVIR